MFLIQHSDLSVSVEETESHFPRKKSKPLTPSTRPGGWVGLKVHLAQYSLALTTAAQTRSCTGAGQDPACIINQQPVGSGTSKPVCLGWRPTAQQTDHYSWLKQGPSVAVWGTWSFFSGRQSSCSLPCKLWFNLFDDTQLSKKGRKPSWSRWFLLP